MRFRLRTDNEPESEDALTQALAEMPLQARDGMRPLVTVAGNSRPSPQGMPFVRAHPYVPDFDKYVNTEGARIVESTFLTSTGLAVEILRAEYSRTFSRKSVVARLMADLVKKLLPSDECQSFCGRYCQFALAQAQATSLAENFRNAADKALHEQLPVVAQDAEIPEGVLTAMKAWIASVVAAISEFKAQNIFRDGQHESLLVGDFIHLMNNRLGFNFLDEAYVAALIAKQVAQ